MNRPNKGFVSLLDSMYLHKLTSKYYVGILLGDQSVLYSTFLHKHYKTLKSPWKESEISQGLPYCFGYSLWL